MYSFNFYHGCADCESEYNQPSGTVMVDVCGESLTNPGLISWWSAGSDRPIYLADLP